VYSSYSKIFPLSINKGGGSSPVDALKSQFGISDKTDYDKIYNVRELVTSKTLSAAIVQSASGLSKYPSLTAWLIEDHNAHRSFWKKKIKANPKDSIDYHITGASLLLGHTKVNNDTKTNFTTITTEAHDPNLSQVMNERILAELSNYYIRMVTEKPRTDLEKIKIMRDSLNDEMYNTERAIAGFIDANQMSVKSSTQLPQSKLVRKLKEVEQLYVNTSTSYQNAKFKLLWESPIFQVLDKAGPPYGFNKPNWKKNAVIAFILTFFLLSLFFSRKVIWRMIETELSGS
jgi:uncharacterized protein involved in exopolysaccharide biosynthesis